MNAELHRTLKEMLTDNQKQVIQNAIDAGRQVNRLPTGRVTLPIGIHRYITLATASGLSEAGLYYRQLTGETQGLHGLGGDNITRTGSSEFMAINNKKRRLRTL